ncbi:mechanosensitive ion channel [Gordonia sp. X0973]|uniref:mechanosensitive ion channel family protein n=1 Tax=Gordonia sp. X0973 TaxID=2742602 RepID=UPI000F5373D7|nr:mechanosensitive ion channel domain-containing protein [Gordonia sp. X0973]QKT08017.1 mechanosensitive ion channel [Gordonia sp. X0973]
MSTDRWQRVVEHVGNRLWDWLQVCGLPVALWVIGGILAARLTGWVLEVFESRVTRSAHNGDAIVLAERAKHMRAVLQVVRWSIISAIGFVVVLRVLALLGVPVAGLVGPGAVIGAAVGFGAQRVVQDLLAGFFIVTEKQYGYGDLVRLLLPGGNTEEGHVEDISLRVTRLRDTDGELITIPNGQVIAAVNQSRDWARAVVDIEFAEKVDLTVVNDEVAKAGEAFREDDRYRPLLLDAPTPLGVTAMGQDSYTVRVVARTLPGKQFEVARDLRVYLIESLRKAGIEVRSGYNPDTPESQE